MHPIMQLSVTIYDNTVLTKAERYTEEQFEDICIGITRYLSLYSYEEVRFIQEEGELKLTYYKNDKQYPIPAEWFRREYEFGTHKKPEIKKLIGYRLPLNTWTEIYVVLEEKYD